MVRKFAAALGVALLLVVVVVGAYGGWTLSGEVERKALAVPRERNVDLVIGDVDAETVTLRFTDTTDRAFGDWHAPGLWGLSWAGGYAMVDQIVELRDDAVVRRYVPMIGTPEVGKAAKLEADVFEGDPLTARGQPFADVTYDSDLGPMGAWLVAGTSKTWAIFVHGVGATREEGLRILPSLVKAGLPTMLIQYRNDAGAPRSASGRYEYGESEWQDIEAAVKYALTNGAENVVLVGYSMGGGIVTSFLVHSTLADAVVGTILDSPMLEFADTVDYGAEQMNLPTPLTWLGKKVAEMRFGFRWGDRDYLTQADKLKAPILVFHGDADRLVHLRTSEALAKARPDLVTLVVVPEATHVRSWNMDPARYDKDVGDFLSGIAR